MVIRIAPVLANTIGDWSVIWQCKCGVYIIELGECPRVAADVIWICGIWACMARTKGAVEVDVHLVLALAAMVLEHELEKHAYFGGL
jgi:hypothetical protein